MTTARELLVDASIADAVNNCLEAFRRSDVDETHLRNYRDFIVGNCGPEVMPYLSAIISETRAHPARDVILQTLNRIMLKHIENEYAEHKYYTHAAGD